MFLCFAAPWPPLRSTRDPSPLEAVQPPVERDPEFRPPISGERAIAYDDDPRYYLRLVANPFLSVFAFLAWLFLTRWVFRLSLPGFLEPLRILFVFGGLVAPFLLLQYHCLDCGKTGRISRWQDHACAAVLDRRRRRRRRTLRGPTPPIQIVLWLWLALVVGFVLGRSFLE
jgi:hypothetical protein